MPVCISHEATPIKLHPLVEFNKIPTKCRAYARKVSLEILPHFHDRTNIAHFFFHPWISPNADYFWLISRYIQRIYTRICYFDHLFLRVVPPRILLIFIGVISFSNILKCCFRQQDCRSLGRQIGSSFVRLNFLCLSPSIYVYRHYSITILLR